MGAPVPVEGRPFTEVYGDADLIVSVSFGTDADPKTLMMAMQYIALCSQMDVMMTRAATRMMGADFVAMCGVLETLRSARHEAITAIARASLGDGDLVSCARNK